MKTSNVLASFLLGSLAAAAPLNKRALVTKTELFVETVVIYTTVWDGYQPAAEATSTPGLFYERPSSKPASSKVAPTPTPPAYTPKPQEPSSVYTPPPPPPPSSVYTPPPAPSSVYTPPPAPPASSAPAPAPAPSSVYVAPPAQPSTPAAQPSKPSGGQPSGDKHHGDITIYDNTGAAGACGTAITDGDMIVALAQPAWGQSTYDYMTGEATNPWCGQQITIEYNGNQIQAKIMDMCPGCSGYDIDLSLSAWKALTGLEEKTRLQADWWKS